MLRTPTSTGACRRPWTASSPRKRPREPEVVGHRAAVGDRGPLPAVARRLRLHQRVRDRPALAGRPGAAAYGGTTEIMSRNRGPWPRLERGGATMPSITGHCPRWCSRDHSAGPSGTAFYHASDTTTVAIAGSGGLTAPNRLDVQTAQTCPMIPASRPGHPRSRSRCTRRPLPADRADAGRGQATSGDAGRSGEHRQRGVTSAAVSRSRDATVRTSPRPAAQCPAPRLPPPGYPPPPNFSSSAV